MRPFDRTHHEPLPGCAEETDRSGGTSAVDERTRFEMYYPPFVGAVEAGVGSIMCSYNRIQPDGVAEVGNYSCGNPITLGRDFKKIIGFDGWVMSDWGATHSTSIMAGLDQASGAAIRIVIARTAADQTRRGSVGLSGLRAPRSSDGWVVVGWWRCRGPQLA